MEDGVEKWICEWCKPSSIPGKHPEQCKILICPKHGRTWHYWESRDPRYIYCHIKGCKNMALFALIPGNQGLCEDHEPGTWMRKHGKGSLFIPDDYWQWKDEEEWKMV